MSASLAVVPLMNALIRRLAFGLCAALAASAALAELSSPIAGPGISIQEIGIYCRADTEATEPAPETALGYIFVLDGIPEFAFKQRQVPARLGISFGLVVTADYDIPGARIDTWRPGATTPDVWYADFTAGVPRMRGFRFDFADELITGLWRMEAYDGEALLYSVTFEVRPGEEMPGVTSDCNLLS